MKIAVLGPTGSYGDEAASKLGWMMGVSPEISYVGSNDALLPHIKRYGGYAVVPVENIKKGVVYGPISTLVADWGESFRIIDGIDLEIDHCLVAKPGTAFEDIRVVRSHPQALMQCGEFIRKYGLETEECTSTSSAAAKAAEDKRDGSAAIASMYAASLYEVLVISRSIQDSQGNRTRFYLVGRQNAAPMRQIERRAKRSIMVFRLQNVPGALVGALRQLENAGINVTAIHSISTGEAWSYNFYVEIEGDLADDYVGNAVHKLRRHTEAFAVLGTVPND